MNVICLMLVIVYAGQACQGILVYQEPHYALDNARSGSSRAEQADLGEYQGHRVNNVNQVKKSLRTTLQNKDTKHKIFSDAGEALHPSVGVLHKPVASSLVRTSSVAPDKRHTTMADSVSEPPAEDIKPPDFSHRLMHHPTEDGGNKNGDRGHPGGYDKLTPFRFSIEEPEAMPCNKPPGAAINIATAPPNVCDLCPNENGKNPLDPCTVRTSAPTNTTQIKISLIKIPCLT